MSVSFKNQNLLFTVNYLVDHLFLKIELSNYETQITKFQFLTHLASCNKDIGSTGHAGSVIYLIVWKI